MATVRAVIAVDAAKGWILHQMDVKNAFLHGDLQEEVYMEQPPGYEDRGHLDYVFANHSLYVQKIDAGIMIITIYVDDLIIGGDALEDVEHVKAVLHKQFDMKDLGELHYFLGIEMICIGGDALEDVEHVKVVLHKQFDMKDLGEVHYFLGIEMIRNEGGGVWLLQKNYGVDMLMKYGMTDCKPILTPLNQNLKLRIDEGEVLDDAMMYCRIMGNLIYKTISRPDLSYAVGLVHGYTDFDWASSVFDRRSTSGYMFSFGSVIVTWSSKQQPTVASSSIEAEYRGATIVACEVAWLKILL
ncbi:hypothetical protein L7F22_003765 [Adiantum nelumboides]|nr:hypothetical protein [Adiantum nelumboides]